MKVLSKNGEILNLMALNFGPSHNATHGCLRYLTALDGETIVASVGEIGYLHRGFEKMAEQGTWQTVLPYTDRLNYCSAILNNIGYAKAAEKMLGVEIPERAKVIRVIVGELSRIFDHFVCVAAACVDLGALSNFWYFFDSREECLVLWEKLTGARLTNSYTRIGGLYRDTYEGFEDDVKKLLKMAEESLSDVHKTLDGNRIFLDRTKVGAISADRALAWGWTGPCLRATGAAFDLRKDEPYYDYETYDWEVVTGTKGDVYDRLMVRLAESEESIKIVRQALARLRPGAVNIDNPKIRVPERASVYQDMESLIGNFKTVSEGIRIPAGEIYDSSEAANGELGFSLISDGTGKPWRVKVRPPCFTQFAAFHELVEGGMIADSIAVLSSINIIAGELDR
ncbi:NADH-quinone oxidoreductase subunit D [Fibrobacterales bacterium]|nr:NADH-quinone oxidoreductase subunit D [Fibrobacterales bacterium]